LDFRGRFGAFVSAPQNSGQYAGLVAGIHTDQQTGTVLIDHDKAELAQRG